MNRIPSKSISHSDKVLFLLSHTPGTAHRKRVAAKHVPNPPQLYSNYISVTQYSDNSKYHCQEIWRNCHCLFRLSSSDESCSDDSDYWLLYISIHIKALE
ncbi:uncharacterized protein LOC126484026 isoform X2 [Schistocerca serialis cubense]|uniref:uncharacterized protein LOC126484026 isoform X2 n=1 Tax=Schistocerca serialis cubense TaxID=2023355 RepID=UPI00214E8216|nr:uncharacterized protein LOC126484026 isoform X2 [Schistocerca serialis cubense]